MDEAPDSTLVRLARQGNTAACDTLIRRYQDRVYTIAFGYLHDPEEALDITQETFLRMVEGLPRFREQANFYTWLYRIVVNRCIDRHRRRSCSPPPTSLQDLAGERAGELAETRPALCPEAGEERFATAEVCRGGSDGGRAPGLEAKELGEQIRAAIAALPEVFRMVVILADIEGLSHAEIAAILRCPVNTVKTRLHRGRLVIRQRLEAYLKGEEHGRW